MISLDYVSSMSTYTVVILLQISSMSASNVFGAASSQIAPLPLPAPGTLFSVDRLETLFQSLTETLKEQTANMRNVAKFGMSSLLSI